MNQHLFILIVSLYLELASCVHQCVPNSSWEPTCERRCDSLNTCSKFKNQECFCKESYYRDMVTGACVERRTCSTRRAYVKMCIDKSSKLQRCEKTCGGHDVCEHKPFQVCHCRNRFYKDTVTDQCVRKSDCAHKVQEKCRRNSSAEEKCERSCHNRSCVKREGVRCFCNKGFFRELNSGKCVRKIDCPPRTCNARRRCEFSCLGKCKNVKRDCYCLPDFSRDPYSMECIEMLDCNKVRRSMKSGASVYPFYVEDGGDGGLYLRQFSNRNLTY